jgi:hypothetical protein
MQSRRYREKEWGCGGGVAWPFIGDHLVIRVLPETGEMMRLLYPGISKHLENNIIILALLVPVPVDRPDKT